MYNHIAKVTDKLYFGKYVDNEVLEELAHAGVDLIIDVTHRTDHLDSYETSIKRVSFPVVDMNVASDERLEKLIKYLQGKYFRGQVIYIHCKGGHGRSACIAACLY